MQPGRSRWWAPLVLISAGVLVLDLVTGPYVQFPIMFVIPVGLAAWHLGRWAGVGFAVLLVACRLAIALSLDAPATPAWAALVNAGIRLAVLVTLAVLLEVPRQKRELADRVHTLEGALNICTCCKKIRRPEGTWEPIESYLGERSQAGLSHGLCNDCAREQYPEYIVDRADRPREAGTADRR